jgi:hypothetical protein
MSNSIDQSKHAHGIDHQVVFDSKNPEGCHDIIKNQIKPALENLKIQFNQNAIAARDELITIKEKLDKTEELVRTSWICPGNSLSSGSR